MGVIDSHSESTVHEAEDLIMEEGEEYEEEFYDPNYRSYPGDVEIPNRIFVKGFSKDTTEEELKCFFAIYGIIHDVKIVCDKSGYSKGYAFVSFDSQEIACKVKKMGKVLYKDRDVVIGPAKIRKRRPSRSSFPYFGNEWQQQSIPSYISPDGVWYFQPMPIMPNPVQYCCTEPTYPCNIQYASPTYPLQFQQPSSNVQFQQQPSNVQYVTPVPPQPQSPPPQVDGSPPQQTAIQYTTVPVQQQNTIQYTVPQQNIQTVSVQQPVASVQSLVYTTLPPKQTTNPDSTCHQCGDAFDMSQLRSTITETTSQQQRRSSPINISSEHKTVMTSPVRCVPIQYDSRYLENTDEPLPATFMYVDASKVKAVVVN